jgi:hypothetical protein
MTLSMAWIICGISAWAQIVIECGFERKDIKMIPYAIALGPIALILNFIIRRIS